jgi:hypothetical protein
MTTKRSLGLGGLIGFCSLSACGAPGDATENPPENVASMSQAFDPSSNPNAAEGHVLITQKALKILADRQLLPPIFSDLGNQALIIYGNYVADHPEAGWPQPDNPTVPLTTEVVNAMTGIVPAAGRGVDHTGINVSFDFNATWNGIPVVPEALIQPSFEIKWMPHDDKHVSTSLRYISNLQIWSNYKARSPSWVLEKELPPNEFALDNLYHYGLGDLKDLNDPAIGEGYTRLRMYPLKPEHLAEDDGTIKNYDLAQKLVARSINQGMIVGADYGGPKYGAILYQISRKFWEANTSTRPDIRDLIRVGNDVPGWHTGRMQGYGEMAGLHMEFPHTYLGGNPYVCADSQSYDVCSDGKPTWPVWIKNPAPTNLADLTAPNPGRSNRAALMYLGWATHMIQDSSLPHHVANWTGKEHQLQDSLGDLGYYYKDYTGQGSTVCTNPQPNKYGFKPPPTCTWVPHPWANSNYTRWLIDPIMAGELDALLGPVGSPKSRDAVCQSLGISDDTLSTTGNGWQSVYGVFLANARRAYAQRKEYLTGDDLLAAGREYVKNAVMGTLKLIYCALPQASTPAKPLARPRVFQDIGPSGNVQYLEPGIYDILWSGARARIANDAISSLEVPAGYKVTLFEHAGEHGRGLGFPSGQYSNLSIWDFDNKASSISVTRNDQRPSFYLRLKRDWIDDGLTRSYGNRRYLDVNGVGTAAGDQNRLITSQAYYGGWSQTWVYNTDTRAIMNPTNGLCLDVPFGDSTNGTPVQMYPCHGGWEQQWELASSGQIVHANGKCLEVGGNDMSAGARVQIWDCVGSEMQSFDVVYGCSHDPCQHGTALVSSCSADVAQVCEADSFCCQYAWDQWCVGGMPMKCQ